MKIGQWIGSICAALLLSACLGGTSIKPRSLYERVGGKGVLVAVVDDFAERLLQDERTGKHFATADMTRFKPQFLAQLCQATGGDCVYQGRDMRSAHAGKNLGAKDFDAFGALLGKSLDRFQVPQKEKDEVLKWLTTQRKGIVS